MFKKDYIFVVDTHELMSFTRFLANHGANFRYGIRERYREYDSEERTSSVEIIVHASKRAINKIYRDLDMIDNYIFDI